MQRTFSGSNSNSVAVRLRSSTTYPTTTLCCAAASIDLFKNGNKQENYFVGVLLFKGMET